MRNRIVQSTVIALCLALGSCALVGSDWYTVRVAVAADANGRTPVPVDLVFVWDKATANKVKGLTAGDWFAQKVQFRRDDPDGRALTICEWEWVPGQAVPDINVTVPAAARKWSRGVFLFANYRSEGPHRASLTPRVAAMLELGRDDLGPLEPIGKDRARTFEPIDSLPACARPRK